MKNCKKCRYYNPILSADPLEDFGYCEFLFNSPKLPYWLTDTRHSKIVSGKNEDCPVWKKVKLNRKTVKLNDDF
jgi:hypothetical protein